MNTGQLVIAAVLATYWTLLILRLRRDWLIFKLQRMHAAAKHVIFCDCEGCGEQREDAFRLHAWCVSEREALQRAPLWHWDPR